jgi:putative hydrolase of the HAD superfamily
MKKDLEKLGLADVKDWVFDLDNTIYPANSSLFPRVAERMTDFIMAHFNLSREEAAEKKTRLFRT